MNRPFLLVAAFAFCVSALPLAALGSEEEFLGWRSVVLQCADTPQAGKISCEVAAAEKGYTKFVIQAFGKEHKLTDAQLTKLAGFPLSSLRTTHEGGYEQLGGYTVHFRFERSRYDDNKKLITEVLYVSVTKNGLTVSEPRAQTK